MSVLKKWEVMKAFEEGAAIEYKDVRCEEWIACIEPAWNWGLSDYRVKLQKWQPSANGDFYVTSDNQIGDYPSSNHVDFGVVFETVVRAKEASVVFIDGLTAICPCCLLPVDLNPHEVVKLNPSQHEPVTNA